MFTSAGRTGMIEARKGAQPRWLEFSVPEQVTWQPSGFLPDGRILFLSMEARRDGPGRPFDEYYTQTPTHMWLHDLGKKPNEPGFLTEVGGKIGTPQRRAVFETPALVIGAERMLVQVVRNRVGQIFSMKLDGSDAREFTQAGEGLPYGFSASPDGKRIAFHIAGPQGYQVWTSDADGGNRIRLAGHPNHLYFGTSWSPDGKWVAYQDCRYREVPSHDWSDLCIGRADGSEHRVLTTGQSMWFGATYGPRERHGGGSNIPAWTRDGKLLFPKRLPGSKVPWEFQPNRPDVDHFNRDFKPESARGGTYICRLDPTTGREENLTPSEPSVWDFRCSESPDGKQIVFCRAETGGSPSIYVVDARKPGKPTLLTGGYQDKGADHPRWIP